MLQFGARVPHSGDVADLLELEGTLEGDRVVVLPAHEEHDFGLRVALGDPSNLRLKFEYLLDLIGKCLEFGDDPASGGAGEVSDTTQQEGDQSEDGDLGGEGFGCGHADLGPGMHVDAAIAFAGDGAGHIVADAEGAVSLALALPERRKGVGGLAALTEDKDERVLGHRKVAVAELAGVFALGRDLGKVFDQVLSHHGGVHGGAASAQDDSLGGAEFRIAHVQTSELGSRLLMGETAAHRIGHRAHLLVDLLEHEVGIVTLADILIGHLNSGHVVVSPTSIDGGEGESLTGQYGDLVVVEIDHIAGAPDDRADITG